MFTPITILPSVGITLAAAVGLILGIAYVFSRVRQADMKILRDSNNDLRSSIDDAVKKAAVMEGIYTNKITGMEAEIKILTDKVSNLEKQNKTLEDIVTVALKQYFFENPSVAQGLKEAVLPSQ